MIVQTATWEDAMWMSSHLRVEDVEEVWACSRRTPEDSLCLAHRYAAYSLLMRPAEGADPVAIFGISYDGTYPGRGVVWLLATPEVSKHARGVLRTARGWLARFLREFPEGVHNIIDSRNALHLRWVRLLGFKEGETILRNGVPFIHIYKLSEEAPDV